MPKVSVKWSGKKFDLDADTTNEPLIFKAALFELTGVVPDRQKVVFQGKTLKDDSWNGFNIKDGSLLMMLGSSGAIPTKPAEDEPMEASSNALVDGTKKVNLPAGMENLGNTCYMNATLQVLRAIPELRTALDQYIDPAESTTTPKKICFTLRLLWQLLDNHPNQAITPNVFVMVLHQCFPQLATKTQHGHNEQQDANECYSEIMRCLTTELKYQAPGQQRVDFKKFVEGVHQITMKNTEAEGEETTATETFNELSCYLSQETKYLQLGINKTTETITKFSEKLGRDAKFEKTTLISRLPGYLTIQMVRFFYKEKEQINAKILKDVKFPAILDVFELCTPELKAKLAPARAAFKEYEDSAVEKLRNSKLGGEDGKAKEEEEKKTPQMYHPYNFPDDAGSNNSGFYELRGVVTHKGRSSNSGHYVGWVKLNATQWVMCDDQEVHIVTEDDVMKLSGGGDWHSAYMLLYGPRKRPLN
uniref:Ubiquitin carboxyl-terminal hydrolase n=1 Tax=Panagrellus redivivus TaxID=6233 RepID=A0A7E4ZWS4_PANRE